MLNLLLLTSAGIIAYLLAYIFNYLEKQRFQRDLRKFFKSELNRYQAIKVMKEAERIMLEAGYEAEEARLKAIFYCKEITENGLLHSKYLMLKEA